MSVIYRVTRRDFLRSAGVGAGALMFGFSLSPDELQAADFSKLKELLHNHVTLSPFVALKPHDGTIVIVTHRPEMGQGIRSSLAAVLADELEADWSRVKLHQPDADAVGFAVESPFKIAGDLKLPFPYEDLPASKSKKYYLIPPEGSQFADSSRSMAAYFQIMRLQGAGIRLVFERAAAKVLKVDASECKARQHKIYHEPSGRSVDFGSKLLLIHAAKEPVPTYGDTVKALKKPADWRFIGKSIPFDDAPAMVTGKAVYGSDLHPRGMLTAMIERCPVANGQLQSFDATAALAVPGVRKVTAVLPSSVKPGGVGRAFVPHAGVAILAENTWAALQGRRALRPHIKWDYGENASYESSAYRKQLEASTAEAGKTVRHKGDVDGALATSAKVVEAGYYVPLLAQAPMEPPMAIALLKSNGSLEVWAPSQNPNSAQQMAGCLAFGIPEEKWEDDDVIDRCRKDVTLHVPLLGGGFGRKSKPDYIAEAALLAAQNPGTPVRVQWTREDDIQFSYYNAVSSQYLKAGLDADGHPTGLLQRSALTSFFGTLFPPDQAAKRAATFGGGEYPYASGIERAQGLEDMPFEIPNLRIENCKAPNHIRTGWMRSVANIYHAFGICSFADEMARAAGRDSKDYLLELIGPGRDLSKVMAAEGVKQYRNNELPLETVNLPDDNGQLMEMVRAFPPHTQRLRAVVERAAKEFGWDEKARQYKGVKGRGLGIAAHRSFLSYVAIVADVSLNDKNELTINEICGVLDCGLAVNPDRVRAQMEGGIVYGLSYALLGEITARDGKVEQHNFDDYPVLRIHQTPKISVHILDSDEPPSGVGEPPTPAVAPALANAIAAAGGPRIREIPFRRHIVVH